MRKISAGGRASSCVATLVAGIYGMNFDHMPELRWELGYPLALALMVRRSLAVFADLKRSGWL